MDLGRHAAKELRKLGIRVDWRATFLAFVDLHGPPVRWGGRLLFRDGWSHAAADYRGPQWPPPQEPRELHRLKLEYQRERRRVLRMELDWLGGILGAFEEMARLRSGPIVLMQDRKGPEESRVDANEKLRGARDRLRDTARELKECEAEIERLEAPAVQADDNVAFRFDQQKQVYVETTVEQLGEFDE